MRTMSASVLLLLLVLPGCTSLTATFLADDSDIYPYCGSYGDVQIMDEALDGEFGGPRGVLAFTYGLIDLPLSLAMDTVLLPYTIPVWAMSP